MLYAVIIYNAVKISLHNIFYIITFTDNYVINKDIKN